MSEKHFAEALREYEAAVAESKEAAQSLKAVEAKAPYIPESGEITFYAVRTIASYDDELADAKSEVERTNRQLANREKDIELKLTPAVISRLNSQTVRVTVEAEDGEALALIKHNGKYVVVHSTSLNQLEQDVAVYRRNNQLRRRS